MKIISWNVNSLNSLANKHKNDLLNLVAKYKPTFLFLQETKLNTQSASEKGENLYKNLIPGYNAYFNSNGGYAGVALYTNYKKPMKVVTKFSNSNLTGRIIIVQLPNQSIINTYVQNSGQGLKNLDYRINIWNKAFNSLIKRTYKSTKKIIICGDLNVASEEIDLANPNENRNKTAGFTDKERDGFRKLLKIKPKFIDVFRTNNPTKVKYSFWTRRNPTARKRNIGWRLDYFLVSNNLYNKKMKSDILTNIKGSDHAPVILNIKN